MKRNYSAAHCKWFALHYQFALESAQEEYPNSKDDQRLHMLGMLRGLAEIGGYKQIEPTSTGTE